MAGPGRPATGHNRVLSVWEQDEFLDQGAFVAQFDKRPPHTPERDLWRAVFVRALKDFAGEDIMGGKYSPTQEQVMAEAEGWVYDDSPESEQPGGFVFVCGVLGYDGQAIRRALRDRGPEIILRSVKRYMGLAAA